MHKSLWSGERKGEQFAQVHIKLLSDYIVNKLHYGTATCQAWSAQAQHGRGKVTLAEAKCMHRKWQPIEVYLALKG